MILFRNPSDEASLVSTIYLCPMNAPSRTELSTLGEFGLIDRLAARVETFHPSTRTGIGDDAAVIDLGNGRSMVVTTDMLVEGIHFDLAYCPLRHLGYKAITVNLSDVAAMFAQPKQVTVSIAISNRFSVEAIDELYEGIRLACEAYKVDLVGGDTTSSRSGLVISVTAIGECATEEVTLRSAAGEGQVVCVTGDLGGAYLGLQVLEREKAEFLANPNMQPALTDQYSYCIGRQLRPEARTDVVYELKELKVKPTAMIDVSDGLASEIMHLSRQSGVSFSLYEEHLPMDDQSSLIASEFSMNPTTCMLNGGEDYELLMTFTQEDYEKIRNHSRISAIGITRPLDQGNVLITKGGQKLPIQAQGWVSF